MEGGRKMSLVKKMTFEAKFSPCDPRKNKKCRGEDRMKCWKNCPELDAYQLNTHFTPPVFEPRSSLPIGEGNKIAQVILPETF